MKLVATSEEKRNDITYHVEEDGELRREFCWGPSWDNSRPKSRLKIMLRWILWGYILRMGVK